MHKFDRIGEVKVLDVYWGQDPDLPEELTWIYELWWWRKDNMVLATDAAIDREMQIMELIKLVNNSDNFSWLMQGKLSEYWIKK